jgi:hypothetical protein
LVAGSSSRPGLQDLVLARRSSIIADVLHLAWNPDAGLCPTVVTPAAIVVWPPRRTTATAAVVDLEIVRTHR